MGSQFLMMALLQAHTEENPRASNPSLKKTHSEINLPYNFTYDKWKLDVGYDLGLNCR
jgi:hypothetical protein